MRETLATRIADVMANGVPSDRLTSLLFERRPNRFSRREAEGLASKPLEDRDNVSKAVDSMNGR